MPITANEGGVLYELGAVTSNEGGVLYELNTVHANEGGVLYEIHSAASFPTSLTWTYSKTTAYTPTVSNNGFTVKNTRSAEDYQNAKSNVFDIKGKVKITLSITVEPFYPSVGSSGGISASSEGGGGNNSFGFSGTGSISKSETYELTTGRYFISFSGGQLYQNTAYALKYTINVSFSIEMSKTPKCRKD